jgi:hypothetical protein
MAIILDGSLGESNASWTTAGRPSSPSAGQMGFNTTLGAIETYNGSAWYQAGRAGNVIQVVSVYTNGGYTTTTSTSYVATTLSASITPTTLSSRFLIFFTGGVYTSTGNQGLYAIHRNGANPLNNQIQNQITAVWTTQAGVAYDIPATTSAITYALYMKASGGTTYWGGDTPLTNTLTIMEIAV